MDFPAELLQAALRGTIREVVPVARGYTAMGRWIVRTDRESVFFKVADTAESMPWLRAERKFYDAVRDTFTAKMVAFGDTGKRVFLGLEDLSAAAWPPPWTRERVDQVLAALAKLSAHRGVAGFRRLEDDREGLTGWKHVSQSPEEFLSLGMTTRAWLDRALPSLRAAESAAVLDGDALLHCDVRSDNLCFAGGRAILVDWNWACVGNAAADVAFWCASLHAEGGPRPEDVVGSEPGLAALVSGYFGWNAGMPAGELSPRVREVQRFQLTAALPWAARALRLPPPDGAGWLKT